MPNRAKIKTGEKPYVAEVLMNWLAQFLAMILPTNLALIAGRGSAKTSEIQVERLIAMMYDMPGAPAAWVADTFTNLQANVLPTVLEGLERKGYRENTHFIIEKQPPEYSDKECEDLPQWLRPHFWKPFNKIVSYKRTIIFFTGFNLTVGSLDRPASLAGRSYVHVFGDEAKYFPEEKIANLLKAVRGYRVQFGRSPFYRGRTFTTDMPNTSNVGEYDWIFKDLKNMDKEMVLTLYKTALVVNEATQEYIAAKERFMQTRTDEDRKEYRNKLRTLNRWYADWYELRKHPKARTVFLLASSYVNVDILSLEYLEDAMSTQLADVNAAILSMRPSLEAGMRFYANLGERHFFDDGNILSVQNAFGLRDREDCSVLRYLDPKRALDVGMDFGNMQSMVVAQDDGHILRCLKTFYVLPPAFLRELADDFLAYFAQHKEKTINLYYDRAGNNYRRQKEDLASKIKEAIERDADGKRTGWKVILKSRNQGNIGQADEYVYMQELLSGRNPHLPAILIDTYNCRPLKASLEGAKTRKTDKDQIAKDKRSEKLPPERLPMESTNMSDAFKYLVMRKTWVALTRKGTRPIRVDAAI